ncbi:putative transcriptional regulator, CopG family [Desulfurococcus amylolyticus 1221n]|uniref:Putative transcriptional regulator, CopG family n=1 Tax=Desulfurococcus amylolyticus (strain DSM 18924 / JCM 16383 / VKM B-2413 / 1221n) TaxID=490899 RepID=B8D3L5_DESA1|nr:CopG family transcriptional regulator [Desulfurococcus amylolyticus]ACL10696.1 putative transcriptional regulator, CopG family [Desulfurococcus amylolyticus 1221n]
MGGNLKKRFGVSVPYHVAEKLDNLAGLFHCDRSTIVSNALNEYIHENLHEDREHKCRGVIVVYSQSPLPSSIISRYSSVITSYSVHRMGNEFIIVIIVEGSSKLISELRRLVSSGSKIQRYLPLDDLNVLSQ